MKKTLLTLMPVFWPKMPPLGIAYLQSYILSNGLCADILDLNNYFYNLASEKLKKEWLISCNIEFEKNIVQILKKLYPRELEDVLKKMLEYDVVGFSCFKSNFEVSLEMVKMLKLEKHVIEIILGGPEIARQFFKEKGNFEVELTQLADMLVVGEGEKPLSDYLRGGNKGVVKFSELESLKSLPFPEYKGIDFKCYPRRNSVSLLLSRGCINRCGFCSERLLYKSFRVRSVKNVIEEIKFHKENNKIECFVFHDSMLNADLKVFEDLCDAIIGSFGSISWEAQVGVRADMPQELFEKIKKSGCYNLFIGFESGCDRTLARMNKGFTSSDALDFFKKLKNARLFFGVSIIVGYPGETEEDFMKSLDFIIKNKEFIPKIEQVNSYVLYDGTPATQEANQVSPDEAKRRMQVFVDAIKKHNIKHTAAFLGNLLEKNQND